MKGWVSPTTGWTTHPPPTISWSARAGPRRNNHVHNGCFEGVNLRERRILVASLGGLIVITLAAMQVTVLGMDGFFLIFMFPLFLWPFGLRH